MKQRKLERLEEAERRAREVYKRLGKTPNDGELAAAILYILDEMATGRPIPIDFQSGETTS